MKHTHRISDAWDTWYASVVDGKLYVDWKADCPNKMYSFDNGPYKSVEEAYIECTEFTIEKLVQFKGNK